MVLCSSCIIFLFVSLFFLLSLLAVIASQSRHSPMESHRRITDRQAQSYDPHQATSASRRVYSHSAPNKASDRPCRQSPCMLPYPYLRTRGIASLCSKYSTRAIALPGWNPPQFPMPTCMNPATVPPHDGLPGHKGGQMRRVRQYAPGVVIFYNGAA